MGKNNFFNKDKEAEVLTEKEVSTQAEVEVESDVESTGDKAVDEYLKRYKDKKSSNYGAK